VMHRQFNEQHLKRRARYLSELEIREVSSVDRAANPGARVLLLKSDNPRKESQMSLQQIIRKSFELRARNKLDKFTLAKLHRDRATELGMTLAKYYDTAEGRQAQTDAVSAEHYEQVVSSSNGDGYARVTKARRNRETKEPVAMGEHAIHHDDPGEDRRDNDGVEEWEKYVGEYRTKYKLDKHRAYDAAMKSPKGQALFARAKSGASYPVDDR